MSDKLKLDESSLEFILNFILNNIKEDRTMALQHHDTLAGLLGGPPGAEGMSGLEIQLMVQELSAALTNFLNTAGKTTDNALKIAKILSDTLLKTPTEDGLSDDIRSEIEELAGGLQEEKDNIISLTDEMQ